LLEKIKAEKERLINEKKIKKTKPMPPIEKDEIPYKLPTGWEWVRLNRTVANAYTGLERAKRFQSNDYQFHYFKMNNIDAKGRCDFSDITKVNATEKEVEQYKLMNNDFLFNTRNSYELVGKTCVFQNWSDEHILFNNNILRIKFLQLIEPEYINIWFISLIGKNLLNKIKSATTNVAAIYQGKLMTFPVPIPPHSEQKRIVAKVQQLMTLCDDLETKLSQSQSDCDELLSAIVDRIAN
jgi:type I restriction enzyme S subunit